MDLFFRLYSYAVTVAGKENAALYNLHKGTITSIPKILHTILLELDKHPVEFIKKKFTPNNPQLLDRYINFLLETKVGFYTHQPESFPALDLTWDCPQRVQVAIVEYQFLHYSLKEVIAQLDALLCRNLELRFQVQADTIDDFIKSIDTLQDKTYRSVDIVVNYCPELLEYSRLETIYQKYSKINQILVDQAPWTRKPTTKDIPIAFTETNVRLKQPCRQHIVNIQYFAEAQQHNPYYNRKVCIDATGFIKNCLHLEQSFGKVQRQSLSHIIQASDFQDLWFASHDKIEVIRDSEFRYALFLPEALEKDIHSSLYHIRETKMAPID